MSSSLLRNFGGFEVNEETLDIKISDQEKQLDFFEKLKALLGKKQNVTINIYHGPVNIIRNYAIGGGATITDNAKQIESNGPMFNLI